ARRRRADGAGACALRALRRRADARARADQARARRILEQRSRHAARARARLAARSKPFARLRRRRARVPAKAPARFYRPPRKIEDCPGFRSFPRKRESSGRKQRLWVPAFAATNGRKARRLYLFRGGIWMSSASCLCVRGASIILSLTAPRWMPAMSFISSVCSASLG